MGSFVPLAAVIAAFRAIGAVRGAVDRENLRTLYELCLKGGAVPDGQQHRAVFVVDFHPYREEQLSRLRLASRAF